MKIKMLEGRLAIEPLGETRKQTPGSILIMPDTSDCTGKVKYIAKNVSAVSIGAVVCYGTDRQRVKIAGEDLEIMSISNIIAILEEEQCKKV